MLHRQLFQFSLDVMMGMLIGLCEMIVTVGMRHGMRMRCAVVRVGKGVVMRVRVTVEQRIINDKGCTCQHNCQRKNIADAQIFS